MKNRNLKIKPVKFNLAYKDECELFALLKESNVNFASETKKMWADRLGVNYVHKIAGQNPKDSNITDEKVLSELV